MAKKDEGNQAQVSGDEVAPEQRDAEGNPAAARDGESVTAFADTVGAPTENNVNQFSPAEEAERQRAEAAPRSRTVTTFDGHDELEEARHGQASTHRATVGRVVVVDEDTEHDGEIYKAGVQDLPLDVADALISDDKAFEPAGKKQGR